jgi:hypothetical protein
MGLTHLFTDDFDFDNIITHVLLEPKDFESLALTCKELYTLCTPFIERHNYLRWHFQKFFHDEKAADPSLTIRTAFDLVIKIATEPIVAPYIRNANLKSDRIFFTRGPPRLLIRDANCGQILARLLADSPYLKEAGLEWKEYYAEIDGDIKARRYSQLAAVFLLTLLPNIKTLKLPIPWKPCNTTDKLLKALVSKARHSHLTCNRPSLARLTRFELDIPLGPHIRFDLDWASPFLALPHMRSFCGRSCVAMDDGHTRIASKDPYPSFSALETVRFVSCSIDEVSIADFLRRTPRLKTLRYSHSTKGNDGTQDWDLCKFVTAIEGTAGSHLVELSVSIHDLRGSITPGKASMRGFRHLQKLEFPLELALCNIAANESQVGSSTDHELDSCGSFIGDLVPTSVSQLSLISDGTGNHEKALKVMFRHLAAEKDSQLPKLKEIHLTCPSDADNMYRDQCANLLAETKKVGVVLELHLWHSSTELTWDRGA